MRELHFLERGVERMDRPELEFALQLYQDRPLLTAVLAGIHPPEGIERIALGLAEGGQGPWIVVTRQGDLVTCLAKGMNPTGLHVVSMGKVAQLVADVMRQREAVQAAFQKRDSERDATNTALTETRSQVEAVKKMLAETDPMERHAMVADFLVEMGLEFAKALSSPDLKFGTDMSFLRSKI